MPTFAHLIFAAGTLALPVSREALITLSTAVFAGIALIVLARRANLPAIVLLLVGGIAFGPEGLGIVNPASLGPLLSVIVALSVGLILFEGGLTLDLRGYTSGSRVIPRLLSIGVLVTWLGTAFCVWAVLDVTPALALLAGSLVIVTGPTVIAPLLRRIKVKSNLHNILHWEGVIIDPIGVFIALLCYEAIAGGDGGLVAGNFALRAVSGILIGLIGAHAIAFVYNRGWIPRNLTNAFALGAAVAVFGVAEAIISEAGLLSVTVAGFVLGLLKPAELKQIRQFKAEITDLLIGLLFIVLAARLEFSQFATAGWGGLLVVALIVLVVRPLNVIASTWGTGLSWREKTFLSWVAPRGIVAASMASLFALGLSSSDPAIANARIIETLTYSVIVATVILQGFSAGWVARLLNLKRPDPTGWMIVGANALNRRIARFIRDEAGIDVVLVDTNARLVAEARRSGLDAVPEDARNVELAEESTTFIKTGHVLALTDNTELNELVCQRWGDALDIHESTFRWSATRHESADDRSQAGRIVFRGMAHPSIIAAELVAGEARVWSAVADGAELPGIPLLAIRKDVVIPLSSGDSSGLVQPGDRVLVLERDAGFFARSLNAGGALDLEATTLEQLYDQILSVAVERMPSISKDESFHDITRPEKLIPTVIGHGIAIPHLYSRHNSHRLCIFARLQRGLTPPGESDPIHLVFFLISPAGDPEGHLATLAEIARFCESPENRQRLLTLDAIDSAAKFIKASTTAF